MRAFYLTALVLTLVFAGLTFFYAEEVSSARWSNYNYNSYDSYGSSSYDSYQYSNEDDEKTMEAGFVTMVFFVFYIVLFLLSLIKIKKTTMKVFSIIGLSLTGIMVLWDGLMIASPSSVSFDEVAPGWLIFGVVMLAFTIIGTIQSFKAKA
jgi:hypothetical protein